MSTEIQADPAAVQGAVSERARDLEGYRGLAALGIVVFHAYQFSRGNATSSYPYEGSLISHLLRNLDGLVSMFFVLSGYLLYRPLSRAVMQGDQTGPVRVFVLRRVVRIVPLYWASILLVWAYRNPSLPGDWRDLAEHLTFTQVFDSKRIFYTIGPAWSLSVEVFFYLFVAVLYAVFHNLRYRTAGVRGRLLLAMLPPALLTLASLAWNGWAVFIAHESATRWAIWFNPLAKADMFAVGMFVAVLQAARWRAPTLRRRSLLGMRLAAAALLVFGCAVRTDEAKATALFNLLSTIAFGLLIASSVFASETDQWRRMLSGRLLAWLGLVSYSLYLWHEPVLLFLDTHLHLSHAQMMFPAIAGLSVAVSIPVAWLSYRMLEVPTNRLRSILENDGTRRNFYPGL